MLCSYKFLRAGDSGTVYARQCPLNPATCSRPNPGGMTCCLGLRNPHEVPEHYRYGEPANRKLCAVHRRFVGYEYARACECPLGTPQGQPPTLLKVPALALGADTSTYSSPPADRSWEDSIRHPRCRLPGQNNICEFTTSHFPIIRIDGPTDRCAFPGGIFF